MPTHATGAIVPGTMPERARLAFLDVMRGVALIVVKLVGLGFTIVFAGFVLHERPRREQIAGASVAFAGLAVIGIDRAASAPVVPP